MRFIQNLPFNISVCNALATPEQLRWTVDRKFDSLPESYGKKRALSVINRLRYKTNKKEMEILLQTALQS